MLQLARAKVNLALHVTGRRDDGYHLLDTIVTFAEIGDQLIIEKSNDLSLSLSGPEHGSLRADADNLVMQAANVLRNFTKRHDLTAAIQLHKYLPVASGIGGGSADAAAALKGLCKFWNLEIQKTDLANMARLLGADVPMCLAGKPSRVSGIGEIIEPVEMPSLALVLVNPRVEVSTPAVFGLLDRKINAPLTNFDAGLSWSAYLSRQRNDLEAPAIALEPSIQDCLNTLKSFDSCWLSRMTGSGATCFGLFDNRREAARVANLLLQEHPDWWIVDTQTIS